MNNSKNQPPGLSPAELKSLLANVLDDGAGDRLEVDIIIDNYSLDNIPKIIEKINKHISSNQDLIKLKFEFTHTQNVPNEEDKKLAFFNQLLDAIYENPAIKHSKVLLELSGLLKHIGDTDPANIFKNQFAQKQRKYHQAILIGTNPPTDPLPLEVDQKTSSEKKPIRRNRENALVNVSSQVNMQQQAEQQSEQQEEVQQQAQQEAQLQLQRQQNISALQQRMQKNNLNNSPAKEKKGITDFTDFMIKIVNKGDVTKQINAGSREYKMHLPRWNILCGDRISVISEAVAQKLMKEPDFFKSGLSLDALPPGFSLHPVIGEPDKFLLDYSEVKYKLDLKSLEKDENSSPLYPTTPKLIGLNLDWIGDHRQFTGLSENDFRAIYEGEGLSRKNRAITDERKIDLFLKLLKATDSDYFTHEKEISIRESLYLKYPVRSISELPDEDIDQAVDHTFYLYPDGRYFFKSGEAEISGELKNKLITPKNFLDPNFTKLISKEIIKKHKIKPKLDYSFQLEKLARIVNIYGAEGADIILQSISSLKLKFEPTVSRDFINIYINNKHIPYDALLNKDRQDALSKVMNFSSEELKVFLNLTTGELGGEQEYLDLKTQVDNFIFFKEKLLTLGISDLTPLLQPQSLPQIGNQNMAVMMQRIITILEHSISPVEQFNHLGGLDLSPFKAYRAITEENECHEKYRFVTEKMGFNNEKYDKVKKQLEFDASMSASHIENVEPPKFDSTLSDFIYLKELFKSGKETEIEPLYYQSLFLRILGKTNNADRYSEYEQIINLFNADTNSRQIIKLNRVLGNSIANTPPPPIVPPLALALIAFATIHDEVLTIKPEIYTQVVDKLTKFNNATPESKSALLAYLDLTNNEDPPVKRPTPEQLLSLIDFHKDLGKEHPWNKDGDLLYTPKNINFLKSVAKLGDVYYEVIQTHYAFRLPDVAAASAKNIAILADVLSIVDLNNSNLEKHRNDLFKILSYCDYTDLTNQKIKDFIDSTLKNFDPIKLQIAMDILSSAKFSKQDSPHPTFENLIGVLETIEKSDIQNETAIFDTIRNSIGFSKLEFSTKNAKDDDGKAIKQLIQDNLEEIKEMLPMLDMEWNDKYNEDPTSLISAIIEKTKGNLALRAAIAIGVGKFFPTMQADTNTRINKYITEKLNQKEDKVEQTNAANIKHFLNAHYFEQLKLDRNLDGLSASLTTLADYETQAKDFIDQISELKNINPKAYKDTVRNLLESHDLNKIPLESLTLLIGSVLKKQKPKFNHSIIKTIVSHSSLKDIPRNNENDLKIKSLIEQVIIPRIINNKTLGIPIPSLNAIIDSIMTINSHDNITNKEIEKIIKLLKIKESKNELISVIHAIAKHNNPKAIIENILRVADVVKSFSIKTTEFIPDFYSKIGKNVDDLSTIGEKFGHHDLSLDEKKNILMILLKTNYIFQDASTKNPENMLNDLLDNILGLEQQKRTEFLSTLANFSSSVQCPYPDAKKIKAVIDAGKSAANLLSELTTDLENSRNDLKKLAIRFDDSKVLQILENMKDLSHEKGLGYPQKKHLHQQFHIVNHLGQHVQLSIDINNPDSSKKYIKNMDDSDIKLLLSQYRKIISDSKSPDLEKKHAKLIYLALLRESMFRTTVFGIPPQGRMPNSTQIIAVLNAMNQGGNNIAEIQTGQGKSLISAMYAAMLQAEGQAVDIATSNLQLAEEGLDENKDFYSYIGVKTSVVTAGMDFNDYQLEGINYSDVSQLALFRSRALIEGAELPKKVSLVLDEADYTLLDDKTQYRYAANLDPTASNQNIFEWIYPLINDFIDETDKNKSLSEGSEDLKVYLLKKVPHMRNAIENIKAKELDTWIDSAISADALYHKMGTAWALKKEERNGKIISVAQLIINATVSPDARWSNGVHQFVHARINAKIIQENKEKPDSQKEPLCPIEPETVAVASLTSKNFLDFYKDREGEVWGITGTIGSQEEKIEHANKFGFKLTSIPSHQINQRITRDPILIETNDAHKQEIFNQILQDMRHKDKRPALVICKDANDAKELHTFLLKKLNEDKYTKQRPAACLQLVSALEQTQSRFPLTPSPEVPGEPNQPPLKMKDYLDQAGHAGTITITTPTLGRGSDYKPIIFQDMMKKQHPHGLFEITSYLDIERNERQFQGRTSRQGAKGETVTILSKEALEADLKSVGENTDISKIKKRNLNKYIKIIRERRDFSATDQRKQSDVLGDIRNIYFRKMLLLLNNLDLYYNDANINNKPDISLYRVSMLKAWENFLLDLDLENAKLLNPILPEKYKGITVLTNRLLDKANLDWETNFNQDASFKWLIEKLPSTESLSDKDLAYKKNEVLQHAYTSHQPPPPKETTRKLSAAHLNKNKWAYNVLDKAPDPELINKAFEYELNALYQKTKKLKKINKSFIDFSISDKFLVLHTTLYQAYSDALARNPHSPKVDQYRALIGKLEKEAKWYVEKTNNPKEKKMISEPRELHSKYLIQHNRTNQLLEFQRKFNSPSDSSIRSILTQARTDMNQFRSTFLSDNLLKMTLPVLYNLDSTDVEALIKLIVEQRKVAYFGGEYDNNNFNPLSTDSKYHQVLDNILAGFIASRDKNIFQKVYEAELQDINILITYLQTKYPKNLELQNKCKKLLKALTTKTDIDIQRQLNSLANDLPDKALKANLLTKINHLNEINIRKKLYKIKLTEPAINEIILPEKIVKPSLYTKLFTPLNKRVINPERAFIDAEKLGLRMTGSKLTAASSPASSPPVSTLPPPVEPTISKPVVNSTPEASPRPIIVENFMPDNSTTVMVQLQTNHAAQSARIVMAENVNIKSEEFKSAAKKAIDAVLKTATEATIFNISEKLDELTTKELTEYLITKLMAKLNKPWDEVIHQINPRTPPAISAPTL